MSEPKIINCGHCRPRRSKATRGIVSVGVAPPEDDIMVRLSRGYVFVTKAEWFKREGLWQWTADGFCDFKGGRWMARPGEMFHADDERRVSLGAKARKALEKDVDRLPNGLVADDVEGNRLRLRPTQRM